MNGLSVTDFSRKLKRLNPSLWVDYQKIAYPYHKDYPTCGLYKETTFIMGVPNKFVPEYTVAALNFNRIKNDTELLMCLDRDGLPPEGKELDERILWRGYKSILARLANDGYIDRSKAQKLFKCELPERQKEYPRNFVHLEIN